MRYYGSMEPNRKERPDITEEPYKGPGALIAGFGYAFIEFKLAVAASLAGGIATAMTFPKQVTSAIEGFASGSKRWRESGNLLQKPFGYIGDGWVSLGRWCESHLPFKEKLQEGILKGERWKPTSMTFGMLTALSFVATLFSSGTRGYVVTNHAKDQLQRAQSEIKTLRTENADLKQSAPKETNIAEERSGLTPRTTIEAAPNVTSEKALPEKQPETSLA